MKKSPATVPDVRSMVYDRWAPRLIAGMVFFIPLFFTSALYDTFDLPKLSLLYVGDVVLLTLWLWQAINRGELSIRRTVLDPAIGFFLLFAILSSFFSVDPALSYFGSYRIYIFGWWPMMAFAALYFFTVQAADSPSFSRSFRRIILCSAVCVGIYGLLQYAGHEIFQDIPGVKGGRVWSSLGNPLYMGALCMMAIPFVLDSWSAVSLAALALCAAGLTLSLSRSAWLGTLAGGIFMAVHYWPHRDRWFRRSAGITLAVAVCAGALPSVRERAQVLLSTREASNASRLEGWKAGSRVWRQYPLLGSGPDTFFQSFRPYRSEAYIKTTGGGITQADAHNDFIQMASTQGLAGFLIYSWLVILFLWRSYRSDFKSKDIACMGASLLSLFVQNQFNFSTVATSTWAAVMAGLYFASDPACVDQASWRLSCPRGASARAVVLLLLGVGLWGASLPARADWHYKQVQLWSDSGRTAIALDHAREAVRLNGHNEIYGTELCNLLRDTGHLDEAWEKARQESDRHPANPDVWNNRGVSAMWMVQTANRDLWEEARLAFEKAISLDPVFVDAWANLAKWNHLQGKLDEEKRIWKKVLELDPNQAMAKRVLGL